MLLCEIKSTVPYSWTEQSNDYCEAEFMVEDGFYRVGFTLIQSKTDEAFWNVEFQMLNGTTQDEHGNVGYGDEGVGYGPSVFGLVITIVKEWINHMHPTYAKFEAQTPKRAQLYAKLVRAIRQPNWQVSTQTKGEATAFIIKVQN